MKCNIRHAIGAILFTGTLINANTAHAQTVEVTKTTTLSEGTVSEFGPGSIFIRTETATQPVRYVSSETTTYVDEDGHPVAVTAVRSGLPVTVYYTQVGDTLVASKVMVRRAASAPVRVETNIPTTTSAGVIREFGPELIVIKTESSPDPLSYTSTKTTTYVDEDGVPVSIETVKSGLPVTVHYTKIGNRLMVSKVIVNRAGAIPAPVIERKKTTTTTTTTPTDDDDDDNN